MVMRTIWSEWTWSGQFPLVFANSPLRDLLGWLTYIVYYGFIVYFALWLGSTLFFCSFKYFIQMHCFQLTFKLWNTIAWILFDYCSVFWSWKCIPGILIPLLTTIDKSINIIQVQELFRTLWSRSRDAVLVGCTIDLGCWEFGMGREWGGGGQFTSNLGPRWTGSHHAKVGIPSK
jgi:hypothetical protein